jgi:hypothetical protein
LGQEGEDLIIRVRTPQTGLNGTMPELAVPDVFSDQEKHNLVVTYDGLAANVYADDGQAIHNFEFLPGLAFFHTLYAPFGRTLTVNPTTSVTYRIFFYLLTFIPIGFVLVLLVAQARSWMARVLFLLAGLILPSLLLELLLTVGPGTQLRPANLLLATAVTAFSALLLTPVARKLLGSSPFP